MKGLDPTCLSGALRKDGAHPKAANTPFTTLHLLYTPHISHLTCAPLPLNYAPLLHDLRISFGVVTHLAIKQGRPLSSV